MKTRDKFCQLYYHHQKGKCEIVCNMASFRFEKNLTSSVIRTQITSWPEDTL